MPCVGYHIHQQVHTDRLSIVQVTNQREDWFNYTRPVAFEGIFPPVWTPPSEKVCVWSCLVCSLWEVFPPYQSLACARLHKYSFPISWKWSMFFACSGVALCPVKQLMRPQFLVCRERRDNLKMHVHKCLMFSSFLLAAVVLSVTELGLSDCGWFILSGKSCWHKFLYVDILQLMKREVFWR